MIKMLDPNLVERLREGSDNSLIGIAVKLNKKSKKAQVSLLIDSNYSEFVDFDIQGMGVFRGLIKPYVDFYKEAIGSEFDDSIDVVVCSNYECLENEKYFPIQQRKKRNRLEIN